MKHLSMLLLFLLGVALPCESMAQPDVLTTRSKESEIDFHVANNGILGRNTVERRAGFTTPRGSGKSYMAGSGFWFGGKKMVAGTMRSLSFITYSTLTGRSWATPGDAYSPTPSARPILYNSLDYNPDGSLVQPQPGVPRWPLWLAGGTTARPGRPGVFEPLDAERVAGAEGYSAAAFVAGVDEQIVFRYHDSDVSRYSFDSVNYALGLQIQQAVYGWKDGSYKDAIVVLYEVVNMSGDTLRDCVAAIGMDADVGLVSLDDHASFYQVEPALRTALFWSEPEAGELYGTFAVSILEAPVIGVDSLVDNTRRPAYRLEGRAGTFQKWTTGDDQDDAFNNYRLMTTGELQGDNGTSDWRATLASTRFGMRPGDTARFALLLSVHPSIEASGSEPLDSLESFIEDVTDWYYSQTFPTAPVIAMSDAALSIAASPNPARDHIDIVRQTGSEATLRLVDPIGRTVTERRLDRSERAVRLDVSRVTPGAYFVVVEGDGARSVVPVVVGR